MYAIAVAFGFLTVARGTEPINIDIGRQLFVDDYLIGKTNGVARHWNKPVKMLKPVIWPGDGSGAKARKPGEAPANLIGATDGGLWWDPTRKKFRFWFQADWIGDVCYAESEDGIKWTYPDLPAIPGCNRVFEKDVIDSWVVLPDYTSKKPYENWNMHISEPGGPTRDMLYRSTDGGVTFKKVSFAGRSGDRSTMYYDPFRELWVFSLRYGNWPRARAYYANKNFGAADCHWRWIFGGDPREWEKYPKCEPWLWANIARNSSLYSFNAVAYESLMLGVMEVLLSHPRDNRGCAAVGLPKRTDLHFVFSRDGKKFDNLRKDPDIASSGWGSGKWDTGYLSATAGICIIMGDELWFYYSGLRGDGNNTKPDPWQKNGMYTNGSIGIAKLRRDGFAGMVADATGELETKPLVFTEKSKSKHLFVNADTMFGSVAAEVLDESGKVISGFEVENCEVLKGKDATKAELKWKGANLAKLTGKKVCFRFKVTCATLFSFWVSSSERGESKGYVAAGGPDYPAGLRDL